MGSIPYVFIHTFDVYGIHICLLSSFCLCSIWGWLSGRGADEKVLYVKGARMLPKLHITYLSLDPLLPVLSSPNHLDSLVPETADSSSILFPG
jgi:hypothetical protein